MVVFLMAVFLGLIDMVLSKLIQGLLNG